ncbi:MAG: T9SS type A sorting domain-containing protein, partial [Bacteroidota bacterium]
LMLSPYYYANGASLPNLTKVFNLPGEIPTSSNDINYNVESSPLIYPNPNNGSFIINFNTVNREKTIIEVYSISGKLISTFTSTGNSTEVNDLNLPNGMYFLNLKNKQISQRKKFIIQK